MKSNKRDFWLTVIVLAVFAVLVVLVQTGVVTLVDSYQIHVLNLCAIYTILGLSMNLFTGLRGCSRWGRPASWPSGPMSRRCSSWSPTSRSGFSILPAH